MSDLGKLTALVARLRAPDGCPWDRAQTLADLRAYLVEEAHEAAAAIDRVVAAGEVPLDSEAPDAGAAVERAAAWDELAGELGDLLFQVAFVARLAEEAGAFTAAGAAERIHAKMVARHPHVFPPEGGRREELADAEAVARAWERRKLAAEQRPSLLAGVPRSLPALTAAYRLTQKAAGVGFDWPDSAAVLAKLDEERAELAEEIAAGAPAGRLRDEVGDLLFTAANLARKLGLDPEAALAGTNAKFRRRFAAVEAGVAARGKALGEASLDEMDRLWDAAKDGANAGKDAME